MSDNADVIVVGAGVVGCSIAYHLALSGAKVTQLERDAIGSGASTHATGSLSLLGAEFSPGASFQLALAGYRQFADLVPRLESETGIDLLYQRRPSLRLALDEGEETLIKSMMAWQREHVAIRWIDGDEVRLIEPRLSKQVRGAVYEDESAQLDSYRLNLALAQAAERLGCEILPREVTGVIVDGDRITGVKTQTGDVFGDMVVVAAGEWSSRFGEWLNFNVPVRPLKGERLMLRYRGPPLPVLISSPKRGHMISRLDGLLSVGSTGGRDYDRREPLSIYESDIIPTESARLELLQRAVDVFPELEDAELVDHLAGSRPLSPDRLPIIGPVPGWDGIMLATGHSTKGIHLGPITGRIVSEWIVQKRNKVQVDINAFLPDRFANLDEEDIRTDQRGVEE